MGGNTGNIRGRRNQSSANGSKTLGSILASDSGNGAGSVRRMYAYYTKRGTVNEFYQRVFDLRYGEFKNRSQWFLSNNFI
jgi:hypothetical protein